MHLIKVLLAHNGRPLFHEIRPFFVTMPYIPRVGEQVDPSIFDHPYACMGSRDIHAELSTLQFGFDVEQLTVLEIRYEYDEDDSRAWVVHMVLNMDVFSM